MSTHRSAKDTNKLEITTRYSNYVIFTPHNRLLKISCHIEDTSVQPMFRQGKYEPHVQYMIENYCKNLKNILDIGANYGQHTILMAKISPDAKIIAIEASQSNIDVLEHNLKENDINNVKIINTYLSDKNGTIDFFHADSNAACAFACTSDYGEVNHTDIKTNIQTHRLDSLVTDTQFDFIKMDIEGAELLAIDGGEEIFRNCPLCLLELNKFTSESFYNTPINHLIDRMQGLGFSSGFIVSNEGLHQINIEQIKSIMINNIMLEVLFLKDRKENNEN
jgi:FkbM family methyltransferase